LSGCESREEKAERFYQSGLALLEAGDVDRALVEFRNVFQYDGFHKEARQTYADTLLSRGEVGEAYSQYLRLIEQYPDTLEVRITLSGIALDEGNWDEVERHGQAAVGLAPDDTRVQAISAALDYRTAVLADDAAGRAAAVAAAQEVLATLPDNMTARRVVIDSLMTGPDPQAALPEIDAILATDPDRIEFQIFRFRLLANAGDEAAAQAQLEAMFARFPDNQEVRDALVTWYLGRQDFDAAEALLRTLAGPADGPADGHAVLISFLQVARGPEAARTELDRLITANTGTPVADLYRSMKASLDFDDGDRDAAIAELQSIIATAEPSDQTRRIKAVLARMLVATDNPVGARALVEEILAEDTTNVDALKMRASWLTAEDKSDDAIVDLRSALGQSPRDPELHTLMAAALERAGSPELSGESLAQAVLVSGAAPAESLRYAQFLLRDNRLQAAEAVLLDARNATPGSLDVLAALGSLWSGQQDWVRTQDIIDTLTALGTPEATELAQTLQSDVLIGQGRTAESMAILEEQMAQDGVDSSAVSRIVMAQMRAGKVEEARRFLDDALMRTPDDPTLLMLSGILFANAGDTAGAEAIFRDLAARVPDNDTPARLLYSLLAAQGRNDEARAALDAGLAATPQSGTLLWIKAGLLEIEGDIDGAIAIYEDLYALDSSNVVVANNLASLIAAHRDDDASLERAYQIARRLRNLEVPALQDTYGWIAFRRGNLDEALSHLEPAAAGLPADPLVQYHLGMTYAALGRTEDAARVLTEAITLAGDSPLPQFQIARDTLAGLTAPPAPTPAPAP
jgi:cellulose synthase operon protein C